MAVVSNLVVVVKGDSVSVSGGTVFVQVAVFFQNGDSYTTGISFAIGSTKAQRAAAVLPILQQTAQNFGHTVPANANILVLGD